MYILFLRVETLVHVRSKKQLITKNHTHDYCEVCEKSRMTTRSTGLNVG